MLSPNALRILDKLSVYKRVYEKGYHFDTLIFSDGDGNVQDVYYFGSKELYGYRAFRVIHRVMIDELKQMVAERHVPIHYNMQFKRVLSEMEDQVEFEFAGGSTASALILTGADGIHSTVRTYIVPSVRPVYSDSRLLTACALE
jgi:2-polyprenyl-6-methoxyphenol hydroxylase-like FAD-dependent oxidoreductase